MGFVLVVLQGQFVYKGLITLLAGKTCLGDLPSVLVHGHLVFLQTVQLVKPFLTTRDDALQEKRMFQEKVSTNYEH